MKTKVIILFTFISLIHSIAMADEYAISRVFLGTWGLGEDQFALRGSINAEGLGGPSSFYVTNKGYIFLIDPHGYRIKKFDRDGKLIKVMGGPYGGPYKPEELIDFKLEVLEGRADSGRLFKQGIDDFKPEARFGYGLAEESDIYLNEKGNIYVNEYGFVKELAPDGQYLKSFSIEGDNKLIAPRVKGYSIAVYGNHIYVFNRGGGKKLTLDGGLVNKFEYMPVFPKGYYYLRGKSRNEVNVFTLDGKFRNTFLIDGFNFEPRHKPLFFANYFGVDDEECGYEEFVVWDEEKQKPLPDNWVGKIDINGNILGKWKLPEIKDGLYVLKVGSYRRVTLNGDIYYRETTKNGLNLLKYSKLNYFPTPLNKYQSSDNRIFGLAIDSDNIFYLANEGKISKYNKDGKLMMAFGKRGYGKGEFADIEAIMIDSQGNILVKDSYPVEPKEWKSYLTFKTLDSLLEGYKLLVPFTGVAKELTGKSYEIEKNRPLTGEIYSSDWKGTRYFYVVDRDKKEVREYYGRNEFDYWQCNYFQKIAFKDLEYFSRDSEWVRLLDAELKKIDEDRKSLKPYSGKLADKKTGKAVTGKLLSGEEYFLDKLQEFIYAVDFDRQRMARYSKEGYQLGIFDLKDVKAELARLSEQKYQKRLVTRVQMFDGNGEFVKYLDPKALDYGYTVGTAEALAKEYDRMVPSGIPAIEIKDANGKVVRQFKYGMGDKLEVVRLIGVREATKTEKERLAEELGDRRIYVLVKWQEKYADKYIPKGEVLIFDEKGQYVNRVYLWKEPGYLVEAKGEVAVAEDGRVWQVVAKGVVRWARSL